MTPLELTYLGLVGLGTAALTAVAGYGGGTILMAVLLQFMTPAVAIPFHGVVQFFSNGWRVVLFRRHVSLPLTWRYLLLLPPGVAVGLWFFQGLPQQALEVLIGVFVLGSLFTRQVRRFREKDLPTWAFFPMGFVAGALNMVVGVVAPLVAALTIRSELDKEALIATLAGFSLAGHVGKLVAFGLVGFDFGAYLVPFLVMAPAVMLGGYLGKALLGWIPERWFQVGFRVLLTVLGLKLVFWDALAAWLA